MLLLMLLQLWLCHASHAAAAVTISISVKKQPVVVGMPAELTCRVPERKELNQLSIFWSFNGTDGKENPIAEGCDAYAPNRYSMTCINKMLAYGTMKVRILRIHHTRWADRGRYTCSIGNNHSSVQLRVAIPPKIRKFAASGADGNGSAEFPLKLNDSRRSLRLSCVSSCTTQDFVAQSKFRIAFVQEAWRQRRWKPLPQNQTVDIEACVSQQLRRRLRVTADIDCSAAQFMYGLLRLRCFAEDHRDIFLLCPERIGPFPLTTPEIAAVSVGPALLLLLLLLLLALSWFAFPVSKSSDVAAAASTV